MMFITRKRHEEILAAKTKKMSEECGSLAAELIDERARRWHAEREFGALKATIQPREKNGRFAAKVAG